mmetsp:Transcript_4852/g.11423  ORF Transcript_4852/g.11423 Transcript_4852/m.11423 type:complete len:372 (-) Transcript_4852:319-1434(-)
MVGRNGRLLGDLKRKWRKHALAQAVGGQGGSKARGDSASAVTVRAEEIVHLYESSKQVLEESLRLPGVEDDDVLHDRLGARLAAARSMRAYFLAEVYANSGGAPAPGIDAGIDAGAAALYAAKASGALYKRSRSLALGAVGLLRACLQDARNARKEASSGVAPQGGSQGGSQGGGGGDEAESARVAWEAACAARVVAELEVEARELEALATEAMGAAGRAHAVALLSANKELETPVSGAFLLDRLSSFDPGVTVLQNSAEKQPSTMESSSALGSGKGSEPKLSGKASKKAAAKAKKRAAQAGKGTGGGQGKAGGEERALYRVAAVPPALEPVPCRPLVFDLAHNFLDFPNLDEKAGAKSETGGLFGWFKRS